MGALISANASFTFDLYKQLNKTRKDQNVFISPLGISSTLATVLIGAKGKTAAQMEKVLHFDEVSEAAKTGARNTCRQKVDVHTSNPLCGQGDVHSKFHELLCNLQKSDPACKLHIVNKLYGQQDFPCTEEYLSCVQQMYNSMPEDVDFRNVEEVRKKINMWVENETQGKIKDLFAEGSLRPDILIALVNAVYFKGKWEKEFKKENTKEEQFRLNKRESKPVQMMHQNGKFKLACIPEMHMMILELPYCKNEFSMLILLPNDITDESTGLEEVENGLTYEKLANWINLELREIEVDVSIPAFKLEETYDLGSVLQEMGMKEVFTDLADLSGMSTIVGLKVSKVVHKCYVEVNEEGTEAAGATGVTVIPKSLPIRSQFKANHPFIFVIKHNPTNAILFYGKYCSP
ncbi:serpin B4 isoform X1 [Microcaecilia unicolor]|uniref:Leukocyte elastase inhibitor n=1 Tax=Microcaecilia unicolor TaxID=1415580 RepID=A0A6P7YJW4_9AMPH|nr:serpin B4-like isoform X1 [Microcaecilia unicolor]XP_030063259.1 serpin B4-like isoform X1 [Microcaecilia unicolor]